MKNSDAFIGILSDPFTFFRALRMRVHHDIQKKENSCRPMMSVRFDLGEHATVYRDQFSTDLTKRLGRLTGQTLN